MEGQENEGNEEEKKGKEEGRGGGVPGTRMSFGANIIGGEAVPAPLAAFGAKANGDGIWLRGGGVKIETRPIPRGM